MLRLMIVTLLVSTVARAAPADPAPSPKAFVAVTGGVLVPQLFNRYGLALTPELWGGAYLLDGRLGVGATVGYAQPSHERTLQDPRFPGGSLTYALTTRDLRVGVGAQWHFRAAGSKLSPYAGARLRLHLVETRSDGEAGSPFGEHRETATKVGGAPYGGVLWRLGPGFLLGELEVDLAAMDQRVTGEANISALAFKAGYALTF